MASASTGKMMSPSSLERLLDEDPYEESAYESYEEIESVIDDLLEKITPLIDLM